MYVYRKSFDYIVGHYASAGYWVDESKHKEVEEAIRRVNYLNGGSGKPYPDGQLRIVRWFKTFFNMVRLTKKNKG